MSQPRPEQDWKYVKGQRKASSYWKRRKVAELQGKSYINMKSLKRYNEETDKV